MGLRVIACVVFLASIGAVFTARGELSSYVFSKKVILSETPEFILFWNFNRTHIIFKTNVQTTGYIGLGISLTGKMANSDMVTGGVVNGRGYFADKFAYRYDEPVVDDRQDWTLIEASENDEFTTLVFIRKLNTCDDKQDIKIGTGNTKVIYSISKHDLPSDRTQTTSCVHNFMGMKEVELVPAGFRIKDTCV